MSIQTDFRLIQQAALVIGTCGLATSALMTGKFGYQTSWVHAVGFVCVTVLAAIIYPAVTGLRSMGFKHLATGIAVAAPFFIALELFGDLGYTIGMRDQSIKGASHQTVKYDDVGVSIANEEKQLKLFEDRFADLNRSNPWAASVNASALRGQVDSAQMAIDQEAARGGCKAKCLERTKDLANLKSQIAVAEEMNKIPASIEATKRKIADLRDKRAVTQVGHSLAKSQSDFVAKVYLAFTGSDAKTTLNPDEFTLSFTEIFIGFFIALGCTFLPTIAYTIAFAGNQPDMAARPGVFGAPAIRMPPAPTAIQRFNVGAGPVGLILSSRRAA